MLIVPTLLIIFNHLDKKQVNCRTRKRILRICIKFEGLKIHAGLT